MEFGRGSGQANWAEANETERDKYVSIKVHFQAKTFFLEKTNDVTDILMEYSSRRSTSREKDNKGIEREV